MMSRASEQAPKGLCFEFAAMIQELRAVKDMASKYLDDASRQGVFPELIGSLEQFQRSPGNGTFRWETNAERPLRTLPSQGKYQPGGKGQWNIVGEVRFLWVIGREVPSKKNRRPPSHFHLVGNASIEVRLLDRTTAEAKPDPLALWHFDIGAHDSPGCFFHTQIGWPIHGDGTQSVLDVPRLPTILLTPMDALEFLLGELFQTEWTRHAVSKSAVNTPWPNLQKQRLLKLLEWHHRKIMNSAGSPWSALKGYKPEPEDLLGKAAGWR